MLHHWPFQMIFINGFSNFYLMRALVGKGMKSLTESDNYHNERNTDVRSSLALDLKFVFNTNFSS